MVTIADNVKKILQQISQAEQLYHRVPGSVQLLAISKQRSIAETGHLVFATLHTTTTVSTIDRIIDVFPQGEKKLNPHHMRQRAPCCNQSKADKKKVRWANSLD